MMACKAAEVGKTDKREDSVNIVRVQATNEHQTFHGRDNELKRAGVSLN